MSAREEKNMKTVLITGASRGIGRCIAENLAKDGYTVIANYNKSKQQALKLQNDLKEQGYNIEIIKADVSKKEEVKNMIEYITNKFGNIDILINNAGIAKLQMFCDVTDDDWDEMINTNLKSAFYCTQMVLPGMIHKKRGCIINISSIWGQVGASCETIYSISKAGVDAMTKSLAKELGPSNIRVNSIAPGVIDTDMNSKIDDEIKKQIENETPLGKIGKPIDIYKCAKWLIEDEFTTGQIVSVNGGYVI